MNEYCMCDNTEQVLNVNCTRCETCDLPVYEPEYEADYNLDEADEEFAGFGIIL